MAANALTTTAGRKQAQGKSFLCRPLSEVLPAAIVIPIFVWGIWVLMLGALVYFVFQYGCNCPFHDEWMMAPIVSGDQPISASWLWSLHNEHRLPLPRLILLALYRVSGYDFRSGMFFNVMALGAMSAWLILAAKKAKGQLRCTDAFFPLLLLNWGHFENLLWSWQVGFVLPTVLAGILLAIVTATNGPLTLGHGVAAGVCLLALPLCGAMGPAYAVPLGLWLGFAAVQKWRSGQAQARRDGLIMGAFSVGACLLAGLYFVAYERPRHHPQSPSLLASGNVLLQYLSMAFGPAGATEEVPHAGPVALMLWLLTVLLLGVLVLCNRAARSRALGLLAVLVGVTSVGAGIAYGRAGLALDAGFTPRYTTLAAPGLCCVYLSWRVYGGRFGAALVPIGLFTLMIFLLLPNARAAELYAKVHQQSLAAFQHDLLAGMPCSQLAYTHTHRFDAVLTFPHADDVLADYLRMLKRARIGLFQHLQDDPPCREVTIPLAPIDTNELRWTGHTAEIMGKQSYLGFALDRPQDVYAIRLKCSYERVEIWPVQLTVSWRQRGVTSFSPKERISCQYLMGGEEKHPVIWVNDRLDQFRIRPHHEPGLFTIAEITLVVKEPEKAAKQSPAP